jgi:hypothetical protein
LFGFPYVENFWRQGFVQLGSNYFLIVTLDKSRHAESFQYADKFLSAERFTWQSQNRMKRDSKSARALAQHDANGAQVHLFVRSHAKAKEGGAGAFYYCGRVQFVSWDGDNPITVLWRLTDPVPDTLHKELSVP